MAEFKTTTGPDGTPVLVVSGELDIAGVDEFVEYGEKLLRSGAPVVAVDLSDLSFIDSSGIGALVRLGKSAAANQRLQLSDVSRPVARVLELTGLTDLFVDRPDS